MKIVVLAGGQSPEREVSLVTGKAVRVALRDLGHDVVEIDPGFDLPHQLWEQAKQGCDFVWIALHGTGGEDGTVQAMLDWLGLPYQGSGYLASALAMDKWVAKQIFMAADIPTPEWIAISSSSQAPNWQECVHRLGEPVIVKPTATGSTVGIAIARTADDYNRALNDAAQYGDRAFVEKFIPGIEITCSILGDLVMPSIEIVPLSSTFYDYEAKYAPGGSRHAIPPALEPEVLARAEAIAKRAYDALHCQGLARTDIRIDAEGRPWVLEVNTLPGMTPTSLSPDAAAALGWTFSKLVASVLEEGLQQHQDRQYVSVSAAEKV
ncbi:MAG: D-alanine--D-alanine ligase [Cyanobacteria bacterium J06642_2]